MAATLLQFWTDEVTRLTNDVAAAGAAVKAQQDELAVSQTAQLDASKAVRDQGEAVTAARKALAGIPMPADGDPLLVAMENALVGLADAQVALASADLAVQSDTAELARLRGELAGLKAALADADAQKVKETAAQAARQVMIDKLTTGDLSTLAADAQAALTNFQATARSRVEGEFPTNATSSKSFLDRVRARRDVVENAADDADAVEAATFTADMSALAQAQRDFDKAAEAVRRTADAGPQLAADSATLARQAALPAPAPPQYPILTQWQHDRLHDATKKSAREDALEKLTAVDAAQLALQGAQQAYDQALYAAMKAEPDKTQAELEAGAVSAEKGVLDTKTSDLVTARAAMSAGEIATVKEWFAAVPGKLWDELEKLDLAAARLTVLANPPTPATLIATLNNAETDLVNAITAARLAERQQDAASDGLLRATSKQAAEHETVARRAQAYAHSAVLF